MLVTGHRQSNQVKVDKEQDQVTALAKGVNLFISLAENLGAKNLHTKRLETLNDAHFTDLDEAKRELKKTTTTLKAKQFKLDQEKIEIEKYLDILLGQIKCIAKYGIKDECLPSLADAKRARRRFTLSTIVSAKEKNLLPIKEAFSNIINSAFNRNKTYGEDILDYKALSLKQLITSIIREPKRLFKILTKVKKDKRKDTLHKEVLKAKAILETVTLKVESLKENEKNIVNLSSQISKEEKRVIELSLITNLKDKINDCDFNICNLREELVSCYPKLANTNFFQKMDFFARKLREESSSNSESLLHTSKFDLYSFLALDRLNSDINSIDMPYLEENFETVTLKLNDILAGMIFFSYDEAIQDLISVHKPLINPLFTNNGILKSLVSHFFKSLKNTSCLDIAFKNDLALEQVFIEYLNENNLNFSTDENNGITTFYIL